MNLVSVLNQKLQSAKTAAAIGHIAEEAMRSLIAATGTPRFVEGRVVTAAEALPFAEDLRDFLERALERLAQRSRLQAQGFARQWSSFEAQTGLRLVERYAKPPNQAVRPALPDDLAEAIQVLRTVAQIELGSGTASDEIAAAGEDLDVSLPGDLVEFTRALGSLKATIDGYSMPLVEVLPVNEWEERDAEQDLPVRLSVLRLGTLGNAEQFGCHADDNGALVWSNELGQQRCASIADLLRYAVTVGKTVIALGAFPEAPWDSFFELPSQA